MHLRLDCLRSADEAAEGRQCACAAQLNKAVLHEVAQGTGEVLANGANKLVGRLLEKLLFVVRLGGVG